MNEREKKIEFITELGYAIDNYQTLLNDLFTCIGEESEDPSEWENKTLECVERFGRDLILKLKALDK